MSNKTIRKFFAVMMTIVTAFTLTAAPALAEGPGPGDFDGFLEDEWREMMEADYLSMHNSVVDPEKMGLEVPEVTFGDVTYEEFEKEAEDCRNSLKLLRAFDFDELDDTQKHDYLVYEKCLEDDLAILSHPDLIEMFRPYTGYFSLCADNFMDFPLYEKDDVEAYFSLLEEFPAFIDKMMAFTKKQAEKGYFFDEYSLDDALYYLDEFTKKKDNNDLIVTFAGNIMELGLAAEEISSLCDRNKDIILNKVIPKVEEVKKFLDELYGARSTDKSMYYLPEGKEYYEALMKSEASTDKSCEEVYKYLTKAVKEILAYRDALTDTEGNKPEAKNISGLGDLNDLMTYLGDHMEGFPAGPELDYTISYLPEKLNTGAMAYYLLFPVDDVTRNIIRVDKDETGEPNALYYTVAHEGLPGHMYQFSWYNSTEPNVLRHELSAPGYEEGWANYVEKVMMDRAPLDWYSAEISVLDDMVYYMQAAAADVAVNGLGYGEAELEDWLAEVHDSVTEAGDLYYFAMICPGQFLSYGYGSARLWGLREQVQSALGDDFDLEEFHRVVLENGSRSLDLVEEDLRAYVGSKGKEFPADFTFFASEKAPEDQSADIDGGDAGTEPSEEQGIPVAVIVLAIVAAVIVIAFLLALRAKRKKPLK